MDGAATFDFGGRVVFVSGGGTGIGRGIASAFARSGAAVVIGGRREAPLKDFCAEHAGAGYVQMDVGRAEDRQRTVDTIAERHGRLDVLVNNAMSYTPDTFMDSTDESRAEMIGVLLGGALSLTQRAMPMLEASRGSIINISSVVGRYVPYPGLFVTYGAAKAGINQFTRALAGEIGPKGVRANVIAPGPTHSEAMVIPDDPAVRAQFEQGYGPAATPLGRYGEPEDVARVALFLASDAARWVTGQVIDASGGWGLTG